MKEEKRISPALILLPLAAALGLGAVAALAFAAEPTPPPEGILCPYCGAGPFATLDEVNEHITLEHPGERLLTHIIWQ
jgi:hypothetical protein